jgi:hypothetical protein
LKTAQENALAVSRGVSRDCGHCHCFLVVVMVMMMMMMMGTHHPANNARNDVMMVVMILSGLSAAGSRLIGEPRIISF